MADGNNDSHMEQILKSAKLERLLPRFDEENIDPNILGTLTDSELLRLGVATIGERIRLRGSF